MKRELLLSTLSDRPLSAQELLNELERRGVSTTLTELLKELLAMEREGLVERVRSESYSPARPLTTALWKAKVAPPRVQAPEVPVARVEEASMAASIPLLDLLGERASDLLPLLDAVESIIMSAEEGLYIATPYVDATLTTIVALHQARLSRLGFIRVLVDVSEKNVALLERLKTNMRNLEYKVLGTFKEVGSVKVKVQGLHLKALAADRRLALVGTFNFRETHIIANYDLGLLVRGTIAAKVWDILEEMWRRTNSP